jgi:taurine--2-oxoglutarate transaminase
MTLSRNPAALIHDPGVSGVIYADGCDPYRCRFAPEGGRCPDCGEHCAQDLEQVLKQHVPERVAAVIVEPIVGTSGGAVVPADDYLPRVRAICDRYEVLLIADEVMTGFGRTGRWFACDHWDVVPDMMTLAKGLTGGYLPMGATMVSDRLAGYWDERPLMHGHTYSGHTLGCAAIVASLGVYHTDKLVQRAAELGDYLLDGARWLQERHPSVGDVRGKGLFVGIELVCDRRSKEPISSARGPEVKKCVLQKCLEDGVFLMSGFSNHTFMLSPPLTITRDQIDEGIAAVDRALTCADAEVSR